MRNSYPVRITFRREPLWIVWQSDDVADEGAAPDGVAVEQGRIVHVRTQEGLAGLAARFGFDPDEDPTVLDLDGCEDLSTEPSGKEFCSRIVEVWNLLGDVASSVGADLGDRGPLVSRCYDKLFFGMNLESVTPAGDHFTPAFSEEERLVMAGVLRRGIGILEAHL